MGVRLATPARFMMLAGATAVALGACGSAPPPRVSPDNPGYTVPAPLPDQTGWGVHVLALERAPNGGTWVGTYGEGIFVWGPRAEQWRHIPQSEDGLSWGFVNSIAFHDSATVWYGTVGNGFGLTTDGGATWRNWTFSQLGPEWQYVAPDGIAVRDDSVYIATADGLRISGDRGATWRCVQGQSAVSGGSERRDDGCTERINSLPSKYLLSLDVDEEGTIRVGHLGGLSVSRDAGRTWTTARGEGLAGSNVRAVLSDGTGVWAATESLIFVDSTGTGEFSDAEIRIPGVQGLPGAPRAFLATPRPELPPSLPGRAGALPPPPLPPSIATSYGMVGRLNQGEYRLYYLGAADRFRPAGDIWAFAWWGPPYRPLAGSAAGVNRFLAGDLPFDDLFLSEPASQPAEPRHTWFARPVTAADGNTHIDGTYRYGSTMGGRFQQHQGVEFNNPAGTPVRAIGDGVVVFAGAAEQGANTVAIRHDRRLNDQYVYSTYYHNTSLEVSAGQRIGAGDIIARVGNTGRATNDHLHLEIHVAPGTDSSRIVDPDVRFPPHTVNPQLWIEPLPGTGTVAGQVFNTAGAPVPGARIHGLVLPYPEETPFSFAETYQDQAHADPAYGEHFAVGDVPAGDYTLGVTVDGQRVWRRVRVRPGMVTWVEFRP
ncbi:MAG TPA: M23 family metallopeptidase [Longimicrobiales bacterium]|nr:M23 family metallopeptidase [Longimicrobiales bacterium]